MAKIQKVDESPRSQSKTGNGNKKPVVHEFVMRNGIIYCLSCGKENVCENGVCANEKCNKNLFLETNSSGIIGGYIELAKKGKLKDYYYKSRYSESIVRMNDKRIIEQLTRHKHGITVQKEVVDKIYNANI